jgi:predicted glycoside hydrolase/deacetylase ChbG (UPF0249 family)
VDPFLQALGAGPEDRFAVVHADDVGMCEATVAAYRELLEGELAPAASAMVPCAWFPAAAGLCRDHPEADMGVHLTLTSEWDAYRWAPISTRDPASGLLDGEGCFPRTAATVVHGAELGALQEELEAQIQRALAAGVDVTHLDCHMAVLFNDRLLPLYAELGRRHRLPLFNTRWDGRILQAIGVQSESAGPAPGLPVFAGAWMSPLDRPEDDAFERTRRVLRRLPPGLSYLIFHPACDGPELRALASDHRARVADFEVLRSGKLASWLAEEGIVPLSLRRLREVLRAA